MAIISDPTGSTSSSSPVIRADNLIREVFINSVLRRDARVDRVLQTSGTNPTVCEITFPMLRTTSMAAREGDYVEVFVGRQQAVRSPLFRGRITNLGGTKAPDVDRPSIIAQDARITLSDSVCRRNYNEVDSGERMSLRDIVASIAAEYTVFQQSAGTPSELILQFNIGSFPDSPVGEFLCRGDTHINALTRLLSEYAPSIFRMAVDYEVNGSILRCFQMGRGPVQNIITGTNPTVAANEQPYGHCNVGIAVNEIDYSQIVNSFILESTDVSFEQVVSLTPKWPNNLTADFETQLSSAELASHYAIPGANPFDNDPSMESVGRRYSIPPVTDLDGVVRRLDIIEGLIQPNYYNKEVWAKVPKQPFLVWYRNGRLLIRFHGFSIQGNDVVLDEPWYETERTSATREYEIALLTPTTLYGGSTTYYVGDGSRYQIGDPDRKLFRDPDGLNELTVKATADFAPDLPTTLNEVGWDMVDGQLISHVPRVIYGRIENTITTIRTPMYISLNATFASRTTLSYETGIIGSARKMKVQRLSTVGGYSYKMLRTHVIVNEEALTENTSFTQAYGTLYTGLPIVVQDDSAALQQLALSRTNELSKPAVVLTRTIPDGSLGYKIGSLLFENGSNTGCTIVEIAYDLTNMVTQIVARNR